MTLSIEIPISTTKCPRQKLKENKINLILYSILNIIQDRIASAGYRYRKWQLGEYNLVARTCVDAMITNKKTGQKGFALIRALNEWDPKSKMFSIQFCMNCICFYVSILLSFYSILYQLQKFD